MPRTRRVRLPERRGGGVRETEGGRESESSGGTRAAIKGSEDRAAPGVYGSYPPPQHSTPNPISHHKAVGNLMGAEAKGPFDFHGCEFILVSS